LGCGYISYQPINNPKKLLEKISINFPPPKKRTWILPPLPLDSRFHPSPHPSTSQFLTLTKLLEGTKVTARANDAVIEANPEGENTLTCKAPTGRHWNTQETTKAETVLGGKSLKLCM